MPELSWTTPARLDLYRIEAYLTAEASAEVAVKMLSAIRDKAALLLRFPQAGPLVRDAPFRSLGVSGTPYLLAYRITGRSIEILRVRHERENWRDAP